MSLGLFQARDTLVASYKQLRAGDVTGGAVYRITVRQLEALIRLSEAHARVRCSDIIEPRDVREVRLWHSTPCWHTLLCGHEQRYPMLIHATAACLGLTWQMPSCIEQKASIVRLRCC